MRSALICLFFVIIVRKEGSHAEEDDDFKPTPIPLNNWASDMTVPAATLQESIKTETPPTVAALPAHYWEDALRHSVYLTLVRDKIDQLITNGVLVSPDSKPEDHASREVDDHDLWEKIKSAPFDRLKEEPLLPSDAIILARGRLLEEKDGYRFAEDDKPPQKCSNKNCTQPKAYWSVKRVRQGEAYPGKYHYELTFSVTSQSTKLLKKPYENPVRTFTIRENAPTERPPLQTYRKQEHPTQHLRSQRAVWVHKNIGPPQKYQKRRGPSRGLERLFSSLFSGEDTHDVATTYRQKPKAYFPHPHPAPKFHTKTSRYVSDREPYHQKKVFPYPVKPPPFRYPRPPIQPPLPAYPQHSYFDISHEDHIPFDPDNGSVTSNPIQSTKPAFLPTPNSQYQVEPLKTTPNSTEHSYNEPETSTTSYKAYNYKPTVSKLNYRPENIRPPVYNAPPGVFVTMDKKPFKPMPPIKSMFPRPHKTLPLDFRPSPQIGGETYERDYTDTNSTADNAFRPMTLDLAELVNSKKGPKNQRKPTTGKRPLKKELLSESLKPIRITTVSPDIITVYETSPYENDQLDWAEILAAFTRTTPMASHKEREVQTEKYFVITTTDAPITFIEEQEQEPTTISTTTTTSTTTTAKARRTRPPPKFKSTEKNKKQRRFNTTTSTTTTPSTKATEKVTRVYPLKNPSNDLTPLASSAATNRANSIQELTGVLPIRSTSTTTTTSTSTAPTTTQGSTTMKTSTTTRASTTSRASTTFRASTTSRASTTTRAPPTTIAIEPTSATTQPKSKNRFRQSTLMTKGTSVNHDKWTTPGLEKNRTTTSVTASTFTLRRKTSKFQGYISSTTSRNVENETNKEEYNDYTFSFNKENISTTTEQPEISTTTSQTEVITTTAQPKISTTTAQPTVTTTTAQITVTTTTAQPKEDIQINATQSTAKDDNANKGWIHDMDDINEADTEEEIELSDVQEIKDSNEFIFPFTSKPDKNSEIETQDKQLKTVIPLHFAENNKTKCKKKQQQNLTTPITKATDVEVTTYLPTTSLKTTTTRTTVSAGIPNFFDEFFGGFTMDTDVMDKPKTTQSTTASNEINESASSKHEEFLSMGDDVANFLSSLDEKPYKKKDDDYDDENDETVSVFHKEDSSLDTSLQKEDDDDDEHEDYYDSPEIESEESKGPLSLLELMDIE